MFNNSFIILSNTSPKSSKEYTSLDFHKSNEKINSLESILSQKKNSKEFDSIYEQLSLLNHRQSLYLLKLERYEKSELFSQKAKFYLEKISQINMVKTQKSSIQLLKISIFQNLIAIYRLQNQDEKALETFKNIKTTDFINLIDDREQFLISGIDTLFLNLANFSYKLNKINDCIIFCQKSAIFNDKMKNLAENLSENHDFLHKKIAISAYLAFLTGKCQEKNGQDLQALANYKKALDLSEKSEEAISTQNRYRKNLEKMERKIDFFKILSENDNKIEFLEDYDTFKSNIDENLLKKSMKSARFDEKNENTTNLKEKYKNFRLKSKKNKGSLLTISTNYNSYSPASVKISNFFSISKRLTPFQTKSDFISKQEKKDYTLDFQEIKHFKLNDFREKLNNRPNFNSFFKEKGNYKEDINKKIDFETENTEREDILKLRTSKLPKNCTQNSCQSAKINEKSININTASKDPINMISSTTGVKRRHINIQKKKTLEFSDKIHEKPEKQLNSADNFRSKSFFSNPIEKDESINELEIENLNNINEDNQIKEEKLEKSLKIIDNFEKIDEDIEEKATNKFINRIFKNVLIHKFKKQKIITENNDISGDSPIMKVIDQMNINLNNNVKQIKYNDLKITNKKYIFYSKNLYKSIYRVFEWKITRFLFKILEKSEKNNNYYNDIDFNTNKEYLYLEENNIIRMEISFENNYNQNTLIIWDIKVSELSFQETDNLIIYIIDSWILNNNFQEFYIDFLAKKNEKLFKINNNKIENDNLATFEEKILFYIENIIKFKSKPNGKIWISDKSINKIEFSIEKSISLKKKHKKIMEKSIKITNNFNFYCNLYGYEKILFNENPTENITKLYEILSENPENLSNFQFLLTKSSSSSAIKINHQKTYEKIQKKQYQTSLCNLEKSKPPLKIEIPKKKSIEKIDDSLCYSPSNLIKIRKLPSKSPITTPENPKNFGFDEIALRLNLQKNEESIKSSNNSQKRQDLSPKSSGFKDFSPKSINLKDQELLISESSIRSATPKRFPQKNTKEKDQILSYLSLLNDLNQKEHKNINFSSKYSYQNQSSSRSPKSDIKKENSDNLEIQSFYNPEKIDISPRHRKNTKNLDFNEIMEMSQESPRSPQKLQKKKIVKLDFSKQELDFGSQIIDDIDRSPKKTMTASIRKDSDENNIRNKNKTFTQSPRNRQKTVPFPSKDFNFEGKTRTKTMSNKNEYMENSQKSNKSEKIEEQIIFDEELINKIFENKKLEPRIRKKLISFNNENEIFAKKPNKIEENDNNFLYIFSEKNILLFNTVLKYNGIYIFTSVYLKTEENPLKIEQKNINIFKIAEKYRIEIYFTKVSSLSSWIDFICLNFIEFIDKFSLDLLENNYFLEKFLEIPEIRPKNIKYLELKMQNSLKIDNSHAEFFISSRKASKSMTNTKISIEKPSKIQEIVEDTMLFSNNLTKLTFYNTIFILNKSLYYIKIDKKLLRIRFSPDFPQNKYLYFSLYDPLLHKKDYCLLTNLRDIEQTINVLQISSKIQQKLALKMFLSFKNQLVGKKLYFFKEFRITSFSKQLLKNAQKPNILQYTVISSLRNEYLKKFFLCKNLFEVYKIKNLGRCYIKIRFYRPNLHFQREKSINFIKFEFFPFEKKTKIHKFLISENDFFKIGNYKLDFSNERILLNQINNLIFNNILFEKTLLYKKICLPFDKFTRNPIKKKMIFNMNFPKRSNNEKIKFLKDEFQAYRIIVQFIKKIDGFFMVFTLRKHIYLDLWTFLIYFPKNGRNFISFICVKDLMDINEEFYQRKFPIEIEEIEKLYDNLEKKLNYYDFSLTYENYVLKNSLQKLNNKNNWLKLIHKESKIKKYLEIKFWEKMLAELTININKTRKIILKLDNYNGIIRELLLDEVLLDSLENLIFLEIFIEKEKETISFKDIIPDYKYKEAQNFHIFLRITDLQDFIVRNEKISLRDILYSYLQTNEFKEKNKKFQGKQAFFKRISDYILSKIRVFNRENDLYIFEEDKKSKPIKKTNISIKYQSLFRNLDMKYMIIYKGVFSIKPKQIITIMYRVKKQIFLICVYNNENSKLFSKKFTVLELEIAIPNLFNMIKMGIFIHVGERIYKTMKNKLMFSIYSHVNEKKKLNYNV